MRQRPSSQSESFTRSFIKPVVPFITVIVDLARDRLECLELLQTQHDRVVGHHSRRVEQRASSVRFFTPTDDVCPRLLLHRDHPVQDFAHFTQSIVRLIISSSFKASVTSCRFSFLHQLPRSLPNSKVQRPAASLSTGGPEASVAERAWTGRAPKPWTSRHFPRAAFTVRRLPWHDIRGVAVAGIVSYFERGARAQAGPRNHLLANSFSRLSSFAGWWSCEDRF
jgi:hypothetical protein